MRSQLFPHACLLMGVVLATACSDNEPSGNLNNTVPDAGTPDSGFDAGTPDSGFVEPDAGFPCVRDQGGEANLGCDPGEVCNLAMDPPACVPGESCTNDNSCNKCADLQNPEECGHGFPLTAFCDTRHGNVCTRSRASCEPCNDDTDCGRLHPDLGLPNARCLDYPGGEKYCGRPASLGCPDGFSDNGEGFCVRSGGCAEEPVYCPADDDPGVNCAGTGQICPREECPDTGGARCSTNDLPGVLGLCIGFCTQNSDCPANLPFCDPDNGLCTQGCTKGSCPNNLVCHEDGECNPACNDNDFCETNYGADTYCNTPGQPPPRIFKGYRDTNSCAPQGCEQAVDCPAPGEVCDRTLLPAECVPGCYTIDDCVSGNLCKSGPQGTYTREQCRALPTLGDDNETEIGVCCNPGCLDRVLQCGIGNFCCGEPDSAYTDPASCLPQISTDNIPAEPGQCFEHGADPWCRSCRVDDMNNLLPCGTSTWTAGFNNDPDIMGGMPFNEQEFCTGVGPMGPPFICTVTCNPLADDTGCPGRWPCQPVYPQCLQDADCGGLPCIGVRPPAMPGAPPTPGFCQCGEEGVQQVSCPADYATINGLQGQPSVQNPRCIEQQVLNIDDQGNMTTIDAMVCIAAYNCVPPAFDPMNPNYPEICGF